MSVTEKGPIYIGGLDRSGKTTMRAFLASHPNIAIPAVGSNMWTYFYGQFGDLHQPANFERCMQALLRYKHVRFLKPDPERIGREFWRGPHTYAHLFSLFLIHFAEREGKARWGAQTGLIERYADELFAAYPGLKVIHMIRDPRDRYEASLARWPKGKGRAGGATARWIYSTDLAERNLNRYPDHYKIVRFESLIYSTDDVLREVCDFLNEPFVPEMLAMPGAQKHRDRLVGDREVAPDACPLSSKYIGQYRGKVPIPEIAFMQLYAGRRMRAYGYTLERLPYSGREWALFYLTALPNQWLRMFAWRSLETVQHKFARLVGRKPGKRMIVDSPIDSAKVA